MRPGMLLAALAVAGAATGLVLAQGPAKPRRVLHEELPALAGAHATGAVAKPGTGANPTAIVAGDKMLPKPSVDARPRPGEPVLGTGGLAADRQTSLTPDSNTGPDSTLHYVSVFNPDVLPFKRMSAFDAVADNFTLHVARTVLTEIPVGGTHDPRTHDRFYGDVLVQLRPGVDVPLPSVAPDMRILSYEIKPRLKVQFSRDGADNFYVRSDETSASGQYRLTFYADASASYFAPSLPPRAYKVRDVTAATPPELKIAMPAAVWREAKVTLGKLGIDDSYDLGVAFNRLVGYFRAFEAGEIKNPRGNIYRDLCDSQAGVCRHRSYAFMVTANALGIATRYVQNEAHAFVEVWFPIRGWQRIDLGGAALRMDVTGANDKELHRPRAEDPFHKPPEYKDQYTQLEGDIRGLTDKQKSDRTSAHRPPSGALAAGGGPGSGDAGSGGPGTVPDRISPDPTLPAKQQDPRKATPDLIITSADTSAIRGEQLRVEGFARIDGKGLPDHRVNVWLAPAGRGREGSIGIGHAVTRADGTFSAELAVPASVDLARYEILISTDEDAYYNGNFSD